MGLYIAPMSPRIIQLPMSGRDRRHYVRELRLAEQAHASLPGRVAEAYAAAHRLACTPDLRILPC